MRVIFCDNHPERRAVHTLSIRELSLGHRPLFPQFGETSRALYRDLCEECTSIIFPLKEKPQEFYINIPAKGKK